MHLSGPRRLSIFLTALWAALIFAALATNDEFSWKGFAVVGLFPSAFVWGCWWVWRGFAHT